MTALTRNRQRLAARYMPLAHALAKPFRCAYPHIRDDFNGIADLALVECAARFDPARGVKFATYARMRILGALRNFSRDYPESEVSNADECIFWHVEPEPAADSADEAEYLIAGFPARHRPLVRLVFVEGLTIEAAASRLGTSRGAAKWQLRSAIDAWSRPGSHAAAGASAIA